MNEETGKLLAECVAIIEAYIQHGDWYEPDGVRDVLKRAKEFLPESASADMPPGLPMAEPPCVEGVTPESLRQQVEAGRVEEREQCAKIAVEHAEWLERREARYCAEAFYIAEQIRARNGSSP